MTVVMLTGRVALALVLLGASLCVWGSAVDHQSKVLHTDHINENLREMQYAVRGSIVTRSLELQKQLSEDPDSLPFDKIISCNIGNPQSLGQKPITFFRQVLALIEYPALMDDAALVAVFPEDVVARAKTLLSHMTNIGAYTHSRFRARYGCWRAH